MNPLSSRRYTDFIDSINELFPLIKEYLELRIKEMETNLKETK